jgi:hypothetical protein
LLNSSGGVSGVIPLGVEALLEVWPDVREIGVADVAESQARERELGELGEGVAFLQRFIAYPDDDYSVIAHILWITHTHLVESFDNTPRLAFLSPEPGSGKSRAMEVTELLVPRPVLTVNATPAYVFRKVSDDAGLPTLLIDEADAIFSGKRSDGNEDLRGLLNSGYRKGATAGRAVVRGKEVFTEEFPSFCPVALAGLNALPETLMTRSIVVPMKRRRRGQKVEPFRRRPNGAEADIVRAMIERVAASIRHKVENAWPELPEVVQDRHADKWEPLITIADALGGRWPELARATAVYFVDKSQEQNQSLGIRLLADIRTVFGNDLKVSTQELIGRLCALEEAPWSSLRGEPITPRSLANFLRQYEVETHKSVRVGSEVLRGYEKQQFHDAWERYLPSPENQLQELQAGAA